MSERVYVLSYYDRESEEENIAAVFTEDRAADAERIAKVSSLYSVMDYFVNPSRETLEAMFGVSIPEWRDEEKARAE